MSRLSRRRPQEIVNLKVLGRLEVGDGQLAVRPGTAWFVATDGSDANEGRNWSEPFLTVQKAVNSAAAGDSISIGPGSYNEEVTIGATKSKLTLVGFGNRGAAFIAPATGNKTALTNHADDVTVVNVGLDGEGTGSGLLNTGARFRAYACKIEGGAVACKMTLGTVAQIAALTHGKGADCLLDDCEICWTTKGLEIVASDYGAMTQLMVRRCKFHNNSTAHFEESGGTASIRFRNLEISDCVFDDDEGGAAPTNFLLLNDDNGNDGIVTRCSFPTAINSAKNLVSTALHWVCNYHTGGISTGQPS